MADNDVQMKLCEICFVEYPLEIFEEHTMACLKEQTELYTAVKEIQDEDIIDEVPYEVPYEQPVLTPLQKAALEFANKKSKIYSKNITENLKIKLINKGLSSDFLVNINDYVKNVAQVTINVNLDKALDFLCKDTQYRNQFETGTSGGSLSSSYRIDWEANLFNKIYDSSAGSEKVKYGALNITNDINGILACRSYGESYLLLKQNVKDRITFVFGDSSAKDIHMATIEHHNSILYYINSALFDDIVSIVSGKTTNTSSNNNAPYIEVQILSLIHI